MQTHTRGFAWNTKQVCTLVVRIPIQNLCVLNTLKHGQKFQKSTLLNILDVKL